MLVLAVAAVLASTTQLAPSVPYTWKSVQMVGAGFVDGVVFHPTAKDVRYARTDMGGAYRWDAAGGRWAPMLDWVPYVDLNFMGVESIAVDPTDPKRVYLACGTYTNPTTPNGAILRSTDGGRSFNFTRVPFKFGGNENGRGNGERMTVDPNDPRVIYLGTRQAGLWRSVDRAATWKKVESFPWTAGPRSAGVVVTLVDPKSRTIFVAVSDLNAPNVYRSDDGGTTWRVVEGSPKGLAPTHMVRGADGMLWLTYGSNPGPSRMTNGAVWKLEPRTGAWTDVTPDRPNTERQFGYAAVAIQADQPNVAIVSSFYRPGGEQIFRTLDGGKTWKPVIGGKETYDYSKAPYTSRVGIHWLFDIEIDPFNPNHAAFTTGYGGHETFNLRDVDKGKPVKWHALATGIEESVALSMLSPTKGAHLVSAIGDYGGFVHRDLDKPAPDGNFTNPHFGNTSSVAAGDLAPDILVRVGVASGGNPTAGNIGYSLDGGRTWSPTASMPAGAREGSVAVSSDGATWIWGIRSGSFRTTDRGKTWTSATGLPNGLRVVADRVDPARFYALDLFGGKLFTSTDGGAHFSEATIVLPGGLPVRGGDRGDGRGGQDQLYTTPGRPGDLWIASANGLYHALAGASWAKLAGVEQIHGFGFGKNAPGRPTPAIYLVGTIRGQRGFFRSDDNAQSWSRINDAAHQWGLVLHITGDPKRYGRVYVGTHGRGIFYGDPER